MLTTDKNLDANTILRLYEQKNEKYWALIAQKSLLKLFRKMSKGVVGYSKFLKNNQVSLHLIKDYSDLELVPATYKKNYFQKFPLKELVWGNTIKTKPFVFTATSGSTGEPTYFLRDKELDEQYSVLAQMFMDQGRPGSTLFIDCFGMGVWIGGLITYSAFRYCALRGYPLTIITPGVNKKEIFHALTKAASNFDNVILAGYPPFIKDVLDEAVVEGINFSKFHMRLLFAAESFSENFRDYVIKQAHVKSPYFDTLNIYGSAEVGAMAFETPLSILIRRLAVKYPKILAQLFTTYKLPTLAQFNPMFVDFEAKAGEILISADVATPLFHYKIGDYGGVYKFSQIEKIFANNGVNLGRESKKLGIKIYELPFVYVYERSDLSTKLYGAIIYPEPIREALLDPKLNKFITGRMTMLTEFDSKHNQYLEINLEMMPKLKPKSGLEKLCQELVVKNLIKKNAEYKNNYGSIPHKVIPKIIFWPHTDPKYFGDSGKQKWIKPPKSWK